MKPNLTKKALISINKKEISVMHEKKNQIFYFLWMFCETVGIAMKILLKKIYAPFPLIKPISLWQVSYHFYFSFIYVVH